MQSIQIREKRATPTGFEAAVILNGTEYPVSIDRPCTNKEEQLLEWYYEQYLMNPYLDPEDY